MPPPAGRGLRGSEHLFPRYHIRPPYGYLNDPNGPIEVDGLVHLYFQYRHTLDPGSPVLWGHVTSPDLVCWDLHRPALVPHPLLGDRDGCWSGNTVLDDAGRVRAFYSGLVLDEPLQRTLAAVSEDGGYTFGAPQEIVAAPAQGESVRTLRDPYVWREGAGWRMALGAGTVPDTAMVRQYSSDDLDTWVYEGPLVQLARTWTKRWDSGVMWECPQVVRLDDAVVALVGSWSPETGVTKVLAMRVPDPAAGPAVEATDLSLVDHGPDFYAASVLANSPYGPVAWGWATEGRTPEWCLADGWSGMLTLPRVLSWGGDGTLWSAPLPTLSRLRAEPAGQLVADEVDGLPAQLEFLLELPVGALGPCTVRLCCGAEELLEIRCDPAAGRVQVDRGRASSDPRAAGGVFTVSDLPQPAALHGFVDGSILELFLPGGRVLTTRFYPTSPPPWRLGLSSADPGASLTVWQLTG